MHIEGEPYERGFQYGHLMAPELAEYRDTMRYTTPVDTGNEFEYYVGAAEDLFAHKIEGEFLDEIRGIADGAESAGFDITWQEVLEINADWELKYDCPPDVLPGNTDDGTDKEHCTAFIATGSYTDGGEVVMAHNTWDDFVNGQYANVILDIEPSEGHRIFMQSYVGMIHSLTDFFVTDAGIMGTETTIPYSEGYDPDGLPEFFRMRKATQYADDMDEWVQYMLEGNSGTADSWLLADSNTGEIMLFELVLEYPNIERTMDGYYIGFNCAIDPELRNLECGGDPSHYDIKDSAGARRVRLTQLLNESRGRLDVDLAKRIIADHYDVYLNEADSPGYRTVDGHCELDAAEYVADLEPYLPMGAVDGAVMDGDMAKEMSFVARWGNSSGMPFDAEEYLREHPQWDYLDGYLKDRPSEPWTRFEAGSGSDNQ